MGEYGMRTLGDKVMDITGWLMMPLAMWQINNEKKWIRILCMFSALITPTLPLGIICWVIGFFIMLYEEI